MAAAHPGTSASTASIEFLDIGQGDTILSRSPEGNTALVDAGPYKVFAAELLRRRSVTSLGLVVLSHHHFGKIGRLAEP